MRVMLLLLGMIFCLLNHANTATLIASELQAAVYNVTESQLVAKYVSLAFCDKQCVQAWNCHVSKQIPIQDPFYIYDNLTLTAGYIGYRPDVKAIILAIRGSENKRNWWEDFNFEMSPYPKCKDCYIHAGFYFDFMRMQSTVLAHIDKLAAKYQVRKIISSGHSLGAALSIIGGLQIKLKYGSKYEVEVHNFGQPRVGDINLAQFMKTKLNAIWRVVHYKDLVPHVPFEWLKYVHPPHEVFFSEDMKSYTICNDSGQDPSCSNKFYPNYNPNDHDFYFMAIDNGANCKVGEQ